MGLLSYFPDADFGGNPTFVFFPPTWRYLWITSSKLKFQNRFTNISSLKMWAFEPERYWTILFDNGPAHYAGPYWDLYGAFRAFAVGGTGTGGLDRSVPDLAKHDFDNDTASILLVRHSENLTTLPIKHMAGDGLNEIVDEALSAAIPKITSRRGPVGVSWVMWPPRDPFKKFVGIHLPLRIKVPTVWSDYDADVWYWIFFFLDQNHKVGAAVHYYSYKVEKGYLSGSIGDLMDQEAKKRIPVINFELNQRLNQLNQEHDWTSLYLLPGKLTDIPPLHKFEDYSGQTWLDTTLCLVREQDGW